jgi:hypothetical protein
MSKKTLTAGRPVNTVIEKAVMHALTLNKGGLTFKAALEQSYEDNKKELNESGCNGLNYPTAVSVLERKGKKDEMVARRGRPAGSTNKAKKVAKKATKKTAKKATKKAAPKTVAASTPEGTPAA